MSKLDLLLTRNKGHEISATLTIKYNANQPKLTQLDGKSDKVSYLCELINQSLIKQHNQKKSKSRQRKNKNLLQSAE